MILILSRLSPSDTKPSSQLCLMLRKWSSMCLVQKLTKSPRTPSLPALKRYNAPGPKHQVRNHKEALYKLCAHTNVMIYWAFHGTARMMDMVIWPDSCRKILRTWQLMSPHSPRSHNGFREPLPRLRAGCTSCFATVRFQLPSCHCSKSCKSNVIEHSHPVMKTF